MMIINKINKILNKIGMKILYKNIFLINKKN
jgi:hypothetical protein